MALEGTPRAAVSDLASIKELMVSNARTERRTCVGLTMERARFPIAERERGGRDIYSPFDLVYSDAYFRFVTAVRSAESLTMPVAPHQFELLPAGLIPVMGAVPTVALKAPVKTLQSPLERFVSE